MKKILTSALIIFIFTGCTSISVRPIDSGINITNVCIEENPKVIVGEFLTVVRNGFDRHGIDTKVVATPAPKECEYVLTYTALKGWDIAPYMHHAELRLERNGQFIGSAEYHLTGKGGLDLTKWDSTKSKMDPVIDELLRNFPIGSKLAHTQQEPNNNGKVIDPKAAKWNEMSSNSLQQKNWTEAIRTASAAIQIDPNYDMPYANRAWAYIEKGFLKEAIRDAHTAIKLNPSNMYAYNNLGLADQMLGDTSKAFDNYKKSCLLGLKTGCDKHYWMKILRNFLLKIGKT